MRTNHPKAAAVSAALRVGGSMRDRRAARGGARNTSREWIDKAEQAFADEAYNDAISDYELCQAGECPIGCR
jgi:hypothetical protein